MNKYFKYIVVLLLIGTVYLAGRTIYTLTGTSAVSISVTPEQTAVAINNKVYSYEQLSNIKLPPGRHKININADGYIPVNTEIELGWRETIERSYVLNLQRMQDVYRYLSADPSDTAYSVAQEKYFLNNTWLAGYIIPDDEEREISVAVLYRENGAWKLIYHNDAIDESTASIMPAEVFDYIKDFGSE